MTSLAGERAYAIDPGHTVRSAATAWRDPLALLAATVAGLLVLFLNTGVIGAEATGTAGEPLLDGFRAIVGDQLAAVLALFAFRRRRWAVIALWVSAGLAGAFCLASTVLGGVVAAVLLAACVATSMLLYRPESKAWFRAQD